MSFYQIEENGRYLTWKLSGGNALFHFIFFRFYSIFLMLLGIGTSWFLYYEEPNSFYWLAGIAAVIPGMIMFFTRYPIRIEFGNDDIKCTTKNVFKGEHTLQYPVSDIECIQTEYRVGKYGGLEIKLLLKNGEEILLVKIPWIRLNKEKAMADLKILAEHSGLTLR